MGEMMALLGASDRVFMGGTWVETGGHNLSEPAAWGKPIVCGPSLFNFAEVSRLLQEAGALEIVESPQQLAAQVGVLLGDADKAEAMGQAGKAVAEANRGALERLLGLIDSTLPRG
jgi:3-deoxy-D-manno-octulosonic-acid transferase